jgi:hypothetical protein
MASTAEDGGRNSGHNENQYGNHPSQYIQENGSVGRSHSNTPRVNSPTPRIVSPRANTPRTSCSGNSPRRDQSYQVHSPRTSSSDAHRGGNTPRRDTHRKTNKAPEVLHMMRGPKHQYDRSKPGKTYDYEYNRNGLDNTSISTKERRKVRMITILQAQEQRFMTTWNLLHEKHLLLMKSAAADTTTVVSRHNEFP